MSKGSLQTSRKQYTGFPGTVISEHFEETLITIANETIPKNSPSNTHNTTWFNNDYKIAIRQQIDALRKFQKEPLTFNRNSFMQLKAKAIKIIKETKRTKWQNFVSQLNSSTKTNSLENGTQNCRQKSTYSPQESHKNNIQITNIRHIADTLADTFSTNSSSKNSKIEFHKYKATKEKQKLNFQSDNTENYNKSFTLSELQEAIQKSHNTTVGPDDVHSNFSGIYLPNP